MNSKLQVTEESGGNFASRMARTPQHLESGDELCIVSDQDPVLVRKQYEDEYDIDQTWNYNASGPEQ